MTNLTHSPASVLICTLACSAAALFALPARADTEAIAQDGSQWSGVYVCPDVRLERECARRLQVQLTDLDPTAPNARDEQSRRVAAFVERGPILRDRQVITAESRAPMEAGVETDPALEWQVRHELMMLAAEAIGRPELRQFVARYQMKPDILRLRGLRADDELQENRQRGTFTEIEERAGSDRVNGMSAGAVVAGAALFTTGATLTAVIASPDPNQPHAKIRPKFGTPGIKLKGQFDLF